MDESEIIGWVESIFDGQVTNGAQSFRNDAAVLMPVADGARRVLSSDCSVEDHDFSLSYDVTTQHSLPFCAGHRVIQQNISDLAAMGAEPVAFQWSLCIPSRWLEHQGALLKQFLEGASLASRKAGLSLAGGDLSKTDGPFVAAVTIWGDVQGVPISREHAQPGDDVWITGPLGASAHGLELLRNSKAEPKEAIERHLMGMSRANLGRELAGVAHACIDLSDGFARDLHRLCALSGVGARIRDVMALVDQAAGTGERAVERALFGGEDFELLFTAAPGVLASHLAKQCLRVGTICADLEIAIEDADKGMIPLENKGFDHFEIP